MVKVDIQPLASLQSAGICLAARWLLLTPRTSSKSALSPSGLRAACGRCVSHRRSHFRFARNHDGIDSARIGWAFLSQVGQLARRRSTARWSPSGVAEADSFDPSSTDSTIPS